MARRAFSRTGPDLFRCRVRGVLVLISRSWLAALALTTGICSASVQALGPSLSWIPVVISGLLLAVAVTLSLLIHELAHALTAKSAGIEIDHIRLFAGGALCRRAHEIELPQHQFLVAAAGPLASTAFAGCIIGVAVGADALGIPHVVRTCLWFLAFVNILIAAANLLPVFPFDGGKLVHSHFWRASRDRQAASRRLDSVGRFFSKVTTTVGVLLIGFGGELLIGLTVFLFGLYLLRLPPPP